MPNKRYARAISRTVKRAKSYLPTPETVRKTVRKLSSASDNISDLLSVMSGLSGMSGTYSNPFAYGGKLQQQLGQNLLGVGAPTATQTETKTKTKTRGNGGPHTYAGRFKKPRKPKRDFFGVCNTRGYSLRQETFGRWGTEPHANYFVISSFAKDLIAKALFGAMVRKLLAKAGVNLGSSRQEVPNIEYDDSTGYYIEYRVFNQLSGAVTLVQTYSTTDNENVQTIVDGATSAISSLKAWLAGDRGNMPHSVTIYRLESAGISSGQLHATVELLDASFYVAVKATCTVQNRTKGEITEGNNGDVVDNQPVKGYLYQFKHGDPRLKQSGVTANLNFLERIPDVGNALIGASSLGADFEEPPKAQWWSNCSKIASVRLQPGQSKTFGLSHVYKGSFKAQRQFASQTATSHNAGISGKAMMLGLTEVLRTSSAELLSYKYEHETVVGAYIKERKSRMAFVPKMVRAEINIDPPP